MTAEYLHQIFKKYQKGDATEISYYSTLEKFVKEFSESKRKKKIEITTIPKKTEAGNPDFRIWDGRQ